ncbi:ABC transporter permease [Sulfurospirillum diekertiae]|uniref:Inner membrane transport permease YbhS n=1 Tax=Sulfurospirillum diekertiae TaxID=1854492 RepID=A0A1Y0HPD9_9BACT|nr:ABC transporter permease [Sulfurospirillum diekertiae]ARU49961.1 Inner membrane transport permease YbhS [Sulfurospirillum diekertiae]ASC94749.1 Inner membrane transport permease YbhS [Sulfurospirillum diekertiae]
MKSKRLVALLIKESLQIIRDPSAILIAVILPLILLFLMGYAVSLDAKHIPLGIFPKSNTKEAHELVTSFVGSPFFDTSIQYDKQKLIQSLQDGHLKGVMEVSGNFGKNNTYAIQLLIDATEPNTGGLIQNYASKIIQKWAVQEGIMPSTGISVIPRYWFNPPLSSRYFLLPGSIAVIMTLIGTLLTALVIAREWERGTMEALMATPASMMEIILGKLIPYFCLGMGSMVLCFGVAYFWYEIPFEGSIWILFLLSAFYLFPSLSIGLLISTVAKNQFVAAQVSIVAGYLPAFLLSGFLFEINNMPYWLQIFTHIIPARYFVESLQTIFLVGDIPSIFIKDMVCMFLVGLFFFLLVVKKSKKGLE